jgi:hypothetical protein
MAFGHGRHITRAQAKKRREEKLKRKHRLRIRKEQEARTSEVV